MSAGTTNRGFEAVEALEGRTLLSSPGIKSAAPKAPPAPAALIYDAGAKVHGKTIGQWSAEWWKWALSFPAGPNPFDDPTGANAGLRQKGPVFFLAGTPGGDAERTFTVPGNKPILVPLLVTELSELELGAGADVRAEVEALADLIDSLHLSIDGVEFPEAELFLHRETSPDFSFVAAPGNPIGVPAGPSGLAVADGYFVMLRPLGKGEHTISYGGGISSFDFSVHVDANVLSRKGHGPGHGKGPHDNADVLGCRRGRNVFGHG
jgi:hypothetical protein